MIIFLTLKIYKYSLHIHDFQNNLIVFQDTATFECYSFQCKETDPYNNPQAMRLVLTLSVCSKDVAWQEKNAMNERIAVYNIYHRENSGGSELDTSGGQTNWTIMEHHDELVHSIKTVHFRFLFS